MATTIPGSGGRMSAEDFFRGLIAALAVRQTSTLNATQPELHRAFNQVLRRLKTPDTQSRLRVDLLDIDYDPLYGLSGWFDRALTRAQRDFLIAFPNPSYNPIKIRVGAEEGSRVLDRLGNREAFLELAQLFMDQLSRSPQSVS